MQRTPWLNLVLLILIAVVLNGCALTKKENRRLTNLLDEKIQPKSTAAKIALAPVALIGGTAMLAIDGAVINPAALTPKVWGDMDELYWRHVRGQKTVRRSAMIPLGIVVTPPLFVLDWAGRVLFAGNQ